MRISLVSEHASPLATLGGVDAGGQNVYVAALARALAARGHEVDVYTRRDDAALPERVRLCAGVEVVHVPVGPATALAKDELLEWMPAFGDWLARDWASSVRSGEATRFPDVVHAHFWMSGVAALRAVHQLGAPIPVVQTFHALGSVKRRFQGREDSSPRARVGTERTIARSVDQVIATCTDEVRELTRMGAVPRDIRVVPCGVDLELFSPAGPPAARRPDPADPRPVTRLVCVGRLVERKGVDTVVQALTKLPDCELVVVGGPAAADLGTDPEGVRLRALAERLGVGERVHLIGRVEHTRLPALLRSADIVVATPWYEPFGIVPLEAMACGRPFVGSAVGGLLDTVLPGVNGVLVPPRDPEALATELRSLIDSPATRAAMGRAARRMALARYGWDRVAEQVEAAYLSLIAPQVMDAGRLQTAEAM